jgi:hypothetical protein
MRRRKAGRRFAPNPLWRAIVENGATAAQENAAQTEFDSDRPCV